MLSNTTAKPLPPIFIGKDLISKRIKRYLQNQHRLLSQALSKDGSNREDTRSIWYSKEHVASWLDEIDYYQADGIRVYFGAYGDDEEGRPPGQLCLLMVLTKESEDKTGHQDIVLEDQGDFNLRAQNVQRRGLGPDSTLAPRYREYNYGSPCPPICIAQVSAFPLD